jgi:hypothetical protein
MDKTLYINEKRGLEIMRDGPSIWIKEDGKAGRRIPMRLVGRVVVIGNVKMDAGSITLFTDNNIPVTFMNKRGEEVAVTLPYNHRLPSHHEEQKVILEREERTERYIRWLSSVRRRLQLRIIGKFSSDIASVFKSNGFRDMDYQDFISVYVPVESERCRAVRNTIYQLYCEAILGNIIKADLDPHTGAIHRRHNYSLVFDFCYAIDPDIDFQTILFFRNEGGRNLVTRYDDGWVVTDGGIRDIIHRFEKRKRIVNGHIDVILDGLFELIRELRV